ncbi:zinc-ribbon and DUF3426 domain-containing protein [Pseudorhodoferax sp.]|uniref:zinc-ribbon and DUF3426 domain-containing protein n=1 Tax=Pseudorhodoferax sp. TaxID=1993553 RepID=UPI0039E4577E
MPDQLRISQGWVRCGQCGEIFDAAQTLHDPAAGPEPAPQPLAAPAPVAEAPAAGPAAEAAAQAPTLVEVAPQWLPQAAPEIPVTDPAVSLDLGYAEFRQAQASEEGADGTTTIPPEPPAAEAPSAAARPDRLVVALAPAPAPLPRRADGGAAPDAAGLLLQRPTGDAPRAAPAAPRVVAAPPPPAPIDPALAELSFLRDAQEPAAAPATQGRAKLAGRSAWRVAAWLLALGLLWQLAVHERDRLGARAPALRPLLNALCAPAGCRVQPLRRIDAVVIDGSSFHVVGDSGYRLSLTLRNRAPYPVALPAIALTLKDITGQAVVRRVLSPQELGGPPDALDPHGEWSPSVDLQMADNAGRARVVGYHLDAFYP